MKKVQSIDDMIKLGADKEEAKNAYKLYELLEPCLKIVKNGRIETSVGSKTLLGLYRTIGSKIFS